MAQELKYINGKWVATEIVDTEIVNDEPSVESQRLAEIADLKAQLADSDYKVVKLAEALAIGGEMPYNAMALHNERQALRDRINELEKEVSHEG